MKPGALAPIRPWFLRRPPVYERPNVLLVGRRGQGKTLKAAAMGLARLRRGERVLANIELVDPREPQLRAERIRSWEQVVSEDAIATNCTIIIDEAPLWMDCRKWNDVPGEVRAYWRQSRHHGGTGFIFTAQNFGDLDKNMRDLLDVVMVCEKVRMFPKRFPVFSFQMAYPEEFSLLEAGNRSKKLSRVWNWMRADAYAAYDTTEVVILQDWKEYHGKLVENGPVTASEAL